MFRYPPARFHFAGVDPLDAIAREAQLSATEEAAISDVPDCPRAEAVLSPLQLSGAGIAHCIVRVPRRSCVLGLVEPGKRGQDQPRRSKNDRVLGRVSR
jgi:hypothetical protein